MKIGVAGLGGVGSNVARHLVQAKVIHLKIVDFDRVEASNLNRQFYRFSQVGEKKTNSLKSNLTEIYPSVKIEILDRKIALGEAATLFSDCGIIVEGFDDKTMKKNIIEELSSTGKSVVSACGIAGTILGDIKVKKIGNCHIVGDFFSDQDDHPLFPPKIGVIAATMASVVLQRIKELENE